MPWVCAITAIRWVRRNRSVLGGKAFPLNRAAAASRLPPLLRGGGPPRNAPPAPLGAG
jgi:hypothetical protein